MTYAVPGYGVQLWEVSLQKSDSAALAGSTVFKGEAQPLSIPDSPEYASSVVGEAFLVEDSDETSLQVFLTAHGVEEFTPVIGRQVYCHGVDREIATSQVLGHRPRPHLWKRAGSILTPT